MMNRPWISAVVAAATLLGGVSCAPEQTVKNESEPPPAVQDEKHDEMAQAYLEGLEDSKKVVVATVNGVPITLRDLVLEMNRIAPQYIKPGENIDPALDEKVKQEALDRLIFVELAIQDAVRKGLQVPPDEIDMTIKMMKMDMGTSIAFNRFLKMSGLTEEELRRQIERNRLYQMVIEREILRKVKVDDDELRQAYLKESGRYVRPETVVVEDVLIMKGEKDTAAAEKANELHSLIGKNGNDILKVAQDGTFTVSPGVITEKDDATVYQSLTKLKEGDISGVIASADGLHIYKVTKKEPAEALSFDDARVAVENDLRRSKAEALKKEWEAGLKENAKIEKTLSVEIGTDAGAPGKEQKEK